ncbi:hypothetical protein BHM03_00025086 [Ensete ventricosum]|uniref:Uncharacterized protein n=1 Tax=Ensete ventricosum TaxID=4639 RepID=A0A445MH33_ENSVE|nr:hypothetical protein BHM03_00025086 [Ensete ventricosum]
MGSLVRTRPLLSRLSDRRASAVSRSYAVAAASRPSSASPKSASETPAALKPATVEEEEVPTSGICRPLSEILRELNKKVPDSLIRTRIENGVVTRHIPWFASFHHNLFIYYADERFFLMTVPQIYREASGTASVKNTGYGDPVQKAEAMAFRRACARLGLGLHLYHEDAS